MANVKEGVEYTKWGVFNQFPFEEIRDPGTYCSNWSGHLEYCLSDLTPEQQRALEHDLGLARRIQAGLLPDPILTAHGWEASYGYEPAGVVSGDYCDLWIGPNEPGTIYFAVGDVSGKGVAASLLMAHLQASFRSLVGAGVSLTDLVGRVNEQLLQTAIPSHYATLACGRASMVGEIEIVNAGHCPPLVVRAGEVEAIGPTGFPVGLLMDRPYELTRFRLGEGDALVLYTDGLTEAQRADGDAYGQARIERLLARHQGGAEARHLVHAVRDDLTEFLGDAARDDDLTVMVLRRSPGCPSNLIRIPEEGLKAGCSPVNDIRGKSPTIVTKLSDDPYMTSPRLA